MAFAAVLEFKSPFLAVTPSQEMITGHRASRCSDKVPQELLQASGCCVWTLELCNGKTAKKELNLGSAVPLIPQMLWNGYRFADFHLSPPSSFLLLMITTLNLVVCPMISCHFAIDKHATVADERFESRAASSRPSSPLIASARTLRQALEELCSA